MKAWGITDCGSVRNENQDAYWLSELPDGSAIAAVCDGMGGANAGAMASAVAIAAFQGASERFEVPVQDPEQYLFACAQSANSAVYQRGQSDSRCTGMGTTLVAAFAHPGFAVVLNEGDSCAFRVREDGIVKITRDHSYVQDLVDRGEITPDQARNHPQKNLITRALGLSPELQADLFQVDLEDGETLLLCSDGLSNTVSEQEILFEILYGGEPDTCCQRLLDIALSRGAPDNVTAVLMTNKNKEGI